MGQKDVHAAIDEEERQRFTRALLDDVQALADLERSDAFVAPGRHIGAEQEMFLVDREGRPAPAALELLDLLGDARYTTELARFNLEFNVAPIAFTGQALAHLHRELDEALARVRQALAPMGLDVVLSGTLPSVMPDDLGKEMQVPLERFRALDALRRKLTGGKSHTSIQGVDDLQLTHDNMLLEGSSTSFQVHLEVSPGELPALHNLAQVITAPVLAAAANSPLLFQRRLWQETRIPIFEQSTDLRTEPSRARHTWQRVSFGDDWVHESVVELFRASIARHRVLLVTDTGEPSTAIVARGEVPELRALTLHNGTVYHWNRACYGVANGVPHLRIEHRPLPAGPTVIDEVANAALFLGLMRGLRQPLGDVRESFAFDEVRANFVAAARHGLEATLTWVGGERLPATVLLTEQLLPAAARGLEEAGIHPADRERYLGVIAERVRTGQTGAVWQRRTFDRLPGLRPALRGQVVTRALQARQWRGDPVAHWDLPDPGKEGEPQLDHFQRVEQLMATRLFTLHPDDLVDVAASVLRWQHLRHLPVEDDQGKLVGLVSYRSLLRVVAEGIGREGTPVPVRDVMHRDLVTIAPDAPLMEALRVMRERRIACLPVMREGRLVGILSERDFLRPAARWLEARLAQAGGT